MIGWNILTWWLQVLRHGDNEAGEDEAERPDPPDPDPADTIEDPGLHIAEPSVEPVPAPGPWRLRSVGAWTGSSSISSTAAIERDVRFCKALGLGCIHLVVNDHSAKREPMDFGTYNKKNIIAFCKRATDEGIAVHLMTWCMPHEGYIRGLGTQMVDLVASAGARSVELDAEEPWVNARRPMRYEDAGALMAEVLAPVPFGVTGIGYASTPKLGPLVRRAKYMTPQCYSTAGNKLDPAKASKQLVGMWKGKFGAREVVVGLAGYRQSGRPGYTKARFMSTAFECALTVLPTDIVYWSLRQIRASRETANLIRAFAQKASHRPGHDGIA